MANLNRVMLIGRLTRDPAVKEFAGGGKVAEFGFAVNNRKKNGDAWVDEPVFMECKVFNRGALGKLADLAEKYLTKGKQVYLEGHLVYEQWTSKSSEKRNALRVIVDKIEFFDGKSADDSAEPRETAAVGAPVVQETSRNQGRGGYDVMDDELPF